MQVLKLRFIQHIPGGACFRARFNRLSRQSLELLNVLISLVIHPADHIMAEIINTGTPRDNNAKDHAQCNPPDLPPAGTLWPRRNQWIVILLSRHAVTLHDNVKSKLTYINIEYGAESILIRKPCQVLQDRLHVKAVLFIFHPFL